jgi:hypothetical protein
MRDSSLERVRVCRCVDEAEDSGRKALGHLYGSMCPASGMTSVSTFAMSWCDRSLGALCIIGRAAFTEEQQRWGVDHSKDVVGHAQGYGCLARNVRSPATESSRSGSAGSAPLLNNRQSVKRLVGLGELCEEAVRQDLDSKEGLLHLGRRSGQPR